MTGLVWGHTFEVAKNKLNDIVSQYEFMHIDIIRKRETRYEYWIAFENGDSWRAVAATESARMNRANISYVDRKIDPMFVYEIIRHCTSAPPYNAIRYFGEPYQWVEEENIFG